MPTLLSIMLELLAGIPLAFPALPSHTANFHVRRGEKRWGGLVGRRRTWRKKVYIVNKRQQSAKRSRKEEGQEKNRCERRNCLIFLLWLHLCSAYGKARRCFNSEIMCFWLGATRVRKATAPARNDKSCFLHINLNQFCVEIYEFRSHELFES